MPSKYRKVILAYLAAGGSRTRLLVLVHRECLRAGLTSEQTEQELALWTRDVDEADPDGAPPPRSDWGKRGTKELMQAFEACDRVLQRLGSRFV